MREHTRLPLIAKIEKPQAMEAAEDIIRAADCVMVARGDLGIELPIEEVPLAQKRLLKLAGQFARPSITATQMLDSMVSSPRPTRAEATDVANAIFDGTDAVMLSQETAVGQYPVETVAMMASIAEHTEQGLPYREWNESGCGATRATPPTPSPTAPAPPRASCIWRDRDADAVRALGPAGRVAPPERSDLRALARARDRPALRPDVGRAGCLDSPPRGDRGADRGLGQARRRARLGQARTACRDHRGPAERPAGTTSLLQIQRV